jgi:hypothetical protein
MHHVCSFPVAAPRLHLPPLTSACPFLLAGHIFGSSLAGPLTIENCTSLLPITMHCRTTLPTYKKIHVPFLSLMYFHIFAVLPRWSVVQKENLRIVVIVFLLINLRGGFMLSHYRTIVYTEETSSTMTTTQYHSTPTWTPPPTQASTADTQTEPTNDYIWGSLSDNQPSI